MKIVSTLKNNGKDNAIKRDNLIGANGKIARYGGKLWKLTVQQVGTIILASAECMTGTETVDMNGKGTVAQDLLKLAKNRLYS